ncbi:hypothetical protein GCM10010149_59360 [Nonomuraea roseoviolacea subsp. roseoviolacea]
MTPVGVRKSVSGSVNKIGCYAHTLVLGIPSHEPSPFHIQRWRGSEAPTRFPEARAAIVGAVGIDDRGLASDHPSDRRPVLMRAPLALTDPSTDPLRKEWRRVLISHWCIGCRGLVL